MKVQNVIETAWMLTYLEKKNGSIDHLLTYGQRDLRKSQIINHQQILNRIIDVKLIGKRGLSY
jgi:hypothetical protein